MARNSRFRRVREDLIDNTGREIVFLLDSRRIKRRLVEGTMVESWEVSVESPVGRVLVGARVGEQFRVEIGGSYVVVKVLEIL